eukprot:CAMPEP_0174748730 /NCGR_PEP_ID=MMETSP1094-20130205/94140_1 /TAXON_ID=156173 /ORGANISM="Chrysochromulina brevifilum, Strain UTEX LB 985" /LENGTH=35 /DNA_ID= /DNA_START= /DNA_END= /DNA_ORIENTATION=
MLDDEFVGKDIRCGQRLHARVLLDGPNLGPHLLQQ